MKRPEMHALLADVTPASDETTLQLNTFTGFRVATHTSEGDTTGWRRTCFSRSKWRLWWRPCWRSWGMAPHRKTASTGSACWRTVSERVHCRKHRGKACLPENKALLSSLIDKDMKEYAQRLFSAAASAGKAGPGDREHAPRCKANMAGVQRLHPERGAHGCTSSLGGGDGFGERREASPIDHVTRGRPG